MDKIHFLAFHLDNVAMLIFIDFIVEQYEFWNGPQPKSSYQTLSSVEYYNS